MVTSHDDHIAACVYVSYYPGLLNPGLTHLHGAEIGLAPGATAEADQSNAYLHTFLHAVCMYNTCTMYFICYSIDSSPGISFKSH